MKEIKRIEKENKILLICNDIDPENPRKHNDNLGEMICWHRRYKLGDEHKYSNPAEFYKSIKPGDLLLKLYLYDHSGITISATPFSYSWDSSQVGYIVARKEKIDKEFNGDIEKAKLILEDEVKLYDMYLTGEVYGYIINEITTCDKCGMTHESTLDSYWGFYGSDFKTNGLYDTIPDNYKELFGLNSPDDIK